MACHFQRFSIRTPARVWIIFTESPKTAVAFKVAFAASAALYHEWNIVHILLVALLLLLRVLVSTNAKVAGQTNRRVVYANPSTSPCVCICTAFSTSQAGVLVRSHRFYGSQFAQESSLPRHHFARTCTIFTGHAISRKMSFRPRKEERMTPLYYAACIIRPIPARDVTG